MVHFFEDFDEKQGWFTSDSRTVSELDLSTFAALTGDFTALHTNEEYARQTVFGQRIAHGALVFSLSIGLTTQMRLIDDTLLAFHGVNALRFVRPVFIGDTIQVAKRVIERKEIDPSRGVIVFETKVTNQHSDTVLMYHDKLLLKRRS